jgi:hypothetical protein
LAISWTMAACAFYNSYYGIRFPEKYIRAKWTVMRGLPMERDSAAAGAAISMVTGAFFFLWGVAALHAILTQTSASLPPLP